MYLSAESDVVDQTFGKPGFALSTLALASKMEPVSFSKPIPGYKISNKYKLKFFLNATQKKSKPSNDSDEDFEKKNSCST